MNTHECTALRSELTRRIEFHQNNHNDPHNVSNAVATALREVLASFESACMEMPAPPYHPSGAAPKIKTEA